MGVKRRNVLILGAGLSGLGAAWHISENMPEANIQIVEKLQCVGGLSMTPVLEGKYHLDFGPHFLTVETEELMRKIGNIMGDDLVTMNRHCLLYFDNRYISYPPSPKNILFELGMKNAVLSTASYINSRIFYPKKFRNFEDWSRYNFGAYLYSIFFKPYTESFWGIPCTQLASKWADARISKMSFIKTVLNVFLKSVKNTSIKRDTLPMYYPKKGIGNIAENIARHIIKKNSNISVKTGSIVKKVRINKKDSGKDSRFEIVCSEDGEERTYHADALISTIPITQFVNMLEAKPQKEVLNAARKLRFRSLIVMYLVTKKHDLLNAQYVYYHGRSYHRLTETEKLSKELCPEGENMLCIEKSCFAEDDVWRYSKEQLFEMFIKDLEKDNVLRKEDVMKSFVIKEECVYPVYECDYDIPLKKIEDYFKNISYLKHVGRPGSFLYLDMDQSLERSFNIAEEMIKELRVRH